MEMLKRLKTHHLYRRRRRRLPATPFLPNTRPPWKGKEVAEDGLLGGGDGDNGRKQIAFLVSSFINLETHVDVLICNITTSSRSSPALCRVTQRLQRDFKTAEPEEQNTGMLEKSSTGGCLFFSPYKN